MLQTLAPTPNHAVDSSTGFIQSLNFPDAFDATKKMEFVQALRANHFKFLATCQQLGISPHTIYKHKRIDKAFDDALRESVNEYAEHLEWVSRTNALEPRSTLERIFQLRALLPDKYARDLKGNGLQKIEINVAGDFVGHAKKDIEAIETTIVRAIESDDSPTVGEITTRPDHNMASPTVGQCPEELGHGNGGGPE